MILPTFTITVNALAFEIVVLVFIFLFARNISRSSLIADHFQKIINNNAWIIKSELCDAIFIDEDGWADVERSSRDEIYNNMCSALSQANSLKLASHDAIAKSLIAMKAPMFPLGLKIVDIKTWYIHQLCSYIKKYRELELKLFRSENRFPPHLSFASCWFIVTIFEKSVIGGMIFILTWQCVSCIMVIIFPHLLHFACLMVFAGAIGDTLQMVLFGADSNFHGARRISQLLYHHILSIVTIPGVVYSNQLSSQLIINILLALEFSSSIGVLWNILSHTPAVRSPIYPYLSGVFLFIIWYCRVYCWIEIGQDILSIRGVQTLTLAGYCAMFFFNWQYFSAFLKRQVMPKDLHPYLVIAFSLLSTPLARYSLLLTLPAVVASSNISPLQLIALVVTSTVAVCAYELQKRTHGKQPTIELSKYEDCRWALLSLHFTPLPHRYIEPRPMVRPLASWVKAMLLYNESAHMQLRKAYPPLNRLNWVRETYLHYCYRELQSLIRECNGCFDLMSAIARTLPWLVMSKIAGFPRESIPVVSQIVTTMGQFVGQPINSERMKKAVDAQREMSRIVSKWRESLEKEFASDPTAADKVTFRDGAIPYWIAKRIFSSRRDFESNVVMLLFAGTHNLENVIGNTIRLLLLHPEQLAALRASSADPHALVNAVIEESIRYAPPIRVLPRTATRDILLPDGTKILKNATITLNVAMANRDAAVHDNPDEFNVFRKSAHKHLGFGFGAHLCNGNEVGRLQIRAVIDCLLLKEMMGPLKLSQPEAASSVSWQHTYAHLEELLLEAPSSSTVAFVRYSGSSMTTTTTDTIETNFLQQAFVSRNFNVVYDMNNREKAAILVVTDIPTKWLLGSDCKNDVEAEVDIVRNLLGLRDKFTLDCCKVGIFESQCDLIVAFKLLKMCRFNLLVTPSHVVTPECGFLPLCGLTNTNTNELMRLQRVGIDLASIIISRSRVTWFQTNRCNASSPTTDEDSSSSDTCEFLLELAVKGRLFSSARDPNSGNISALVVTTDKSNISFWITPRQVPKPELTVKDFVKVFKSQTPSLCLECSVPSHLPVSAKSSIDAGMQSVLYAELPWLVAILHFHYNPDIVVIADVRTLFPYPCGVLQEAYEVLGSLSADSQRSDSRHNKCLKGCLNNRSIAVELVHHGYLILLDQSGLDRMKADWSELKLQQVTDQQLCPIFIGSRLGGYRVKSFDKENNFHYTNHWFEEFRDMQEDAAASGSSTEDHNECAFVPSENYYCMCSLCSR